MRGGPVLHEKMIIVISLFFASLFGCTDVHTKKVDLDNQVLIQNAKEAAENRTGFDCALERSKSFVEVGGKVVGHQVATEYRDLYFYRFDCSGERVFVTCEYFDQSGADYDPVLSCY